MKPKNRAAAKPSAGQLKADQWHSQAMLRHRAGKLSEAEPLYREALKQHPQHFDALHMLGVLYAQSSRPAEAIELIQQALEQKPDDLDALNNIAGACNLLHRFSEALGYFDRVIAQQASNAQTHTSRSDALRGLNRHAEALAAAHQALQIDPDLLRARIAQANALRRLNRFDEALAAIDKVLDKTPDSPEALNDRSNVLFDLRRFEDALGGLERALELRSNYLEASFNRANCLRALHRHAEAVEAYDQLITQYPDHAEALNNRGAALEYLGDFNAAIASYEAACTSNPQHIMAHLNQGLCHLLLGKLAAGWPLYQWRWQADEARLNDRQLAIPRWDGVSPLAGRRILLLTEQGLGDTLQFCRYAPILAAQGANVVLEVWPPLASVLSRLEGVTQLLVRGESLPAVDCYLPLLDLPDALGTDLHNIPAQTPYLTADTVHLSAWAEKLKPPTATRLERIGLVWSGNVQHSNDHNRSIPLSLLAPLLNYPAQWICLQPEVRESDMQAFRASPLQDLRKELKDFEDTAAIISQLDRVICVDTSVAHLAGALGKETWLLLPAKPDWRWLLERSDSPWYPGMRLFRQPSHGDWATVITAVKTALEAA